MSCPIKEIRALIYYFPIKKLRMFRTERRLAFRRVFMRVKAHWCVLIIGKARRRVRWVLMTELNLKLAT